MMSMVVVTVVLIMIIIIGVVLILPRCHCFQQHAMIQGLQKLVLYRSSGIGGDGGEQSEDWCVVCQCHVSKGERVRWLRGCNHRFHADCIGPWLKEHNTCPLCRNQVLVLLTHHHHHSLIPIFQSLSDAFIALLYRILPSTIRDTFPIVH